MFDYCIIHDQLRALKTNGLQLSYKANKSTVQYVSMIQEVISYYIKSHVVMYMLDEPHAFDCKFKPVVIYNIFGWLAALRS